MVERSRRARGKHKLLGNHQRSWLWGRNLVRETLLGERWPLVELYLADDLAPAQIAEATRLAERLGVPVRIAPPQRLQQLAHTGEHQGYLARMGPFPYTPAETLLDAAPERPLFLILDAIQDPFNFGAMLRSAAAFGVAGVFVGTQRQVPVTSLVARSSAGVVNRVGIAQVDDLVAFVHTLQQRGIRVIGATEKAVAPLTEQDFCGGTAIILGNEGTGIRAELLAVCDALGRIPLAAAVDSLNAAAAAAVFLFEANRQRDSIR